MKRKWIEDLSRGYAVYRCKICGKQLIKKRDLLFHATKHTKWDKRGNSESRTGFAYYFIDKKPYTEAISLEGLD